MAKILAAIVFALLIGNAASAAESHLRLLVHGTNDAEEGLGLAGWAIAPNITDSPTWLALAGPRYAGNGWDAEFMAGAVVSNGTATPILDLRLALTPDYFGIPILSWTNAQWIDPGKQNLAYFYTQLDYALAGIGFIGIESENLFGGKENDLSAGPNLVLPIGKMALVAAYQIHGGANNRFWIRIVLNF